MVMHASHSSPDYLDGPDQHFSYMNPKIELSDSKGRIFRKYTADALPLFGAAPCNKAKLKKGNRGGRKLLKI